MMMYCCICFTRKKYTDAYTSTYIHMFMKRIKNVADFNDTTFLLLPLLFTWCKYSAHYFDCRARGRKKHENDKEANKQSNRKVTSRRIHAHAVCRYYSYIHTYIYDRHHCSSLWWWVRKIMKQKQNCTIFVLYICIYVCKAKQKKREKSQIKTCDTCKIYTWNVTA